MRLGLLSTANINRHVIPGAKESPEVDLVAVASRSQQAADAYAEKWEIPRAHGSYEALLEDPDVDAVYISLPNGLHVDWSVRALEAGKHVLCEKPLDRNPAEVERAFDAAERADRILMEAFMYRHNPQTRRLSALVEEGALGEVRLIRASFSFMLTEETNVRLSAELDGGALMDVGCYCVSGSRLLAGEPELALGRQLVGPSGVDVRFAGTLVFPGGAMSQFDCGFDLPDRSNLEVVGSEGVARIASPWHVRPPGIELVRGGNVEQVEIPPADSYRLEVENLARAIRGEEAPLLGRDDALGQARAIEALYRSAEAGGEPVNI
jgi:D-xylose 1-dehydrogenase (NADP+, D-xylono-1,5-lactone-forming)